MNKERKNKTIKKTISDTRERHSYMDCRTYEVKVVGSKLSRSQKDQVNQYFREAKWLRNFIIADLENANRDAKSVIVKIGNDFEERTLEILGSQVKQDIYDKVRSEIKGLSTKKKQGYKIGTLKFKSYCNSIPLRQLGKTYYIDRDHNRVRIQNIRKPFYVRGLKQIPEDAEFANAKMIRKASGLYFHITVFEPKHEVQVTNKSIGIDFGIENNLTLSDGAVYNITIPESKSVKLASRRKSRSYIKNGRKHSHRDRKRRQLLARAYERDMNKRQDMANKICHILIKEYDFIAIQDEMIHNWHSGLFGKQVQHSSMGSIKAKLKTNSKTHVIGRSFPSTQVCPVCGCLTKHPLSKRDYDCPECGYHHNSRDQKSAQSILEEALRQVSMEHRTQSLVEAESTASVSQDTECKIPPMKREAHVL